MKTNLKIATMSSMALLAVSSMATPYTSYSNDIFGKTLMSAYILGETEAGTVNPTVNPLHDAGSFAMTPNKTAALSGDQFYVVMNSDGFFDDKKQDLISFDVTEDPTFAVNTLQVERRVVAHADAVVGDVSQFTVNSVNTNGKIALKLGKGSGNSNEWGYIMANSIGATNIINYGNVGNYVGLAFSASTVQNVPTVGENGWMLNTTFGKEIVASENAGTVQVGGYSSNGRVLGAVSAANSDNRGSVTYNSVSGIAAVLRTKQTATVGMTSIQHVTAVAVYRIDVSTPGAPVLKDLDGVANVNGTELPLPTAVTTGRDLVGTNYFSRSAFAGPIQVAVNDNGDIALTTVAVDVLDTTDTAQNQERGFRTDKRVISAFYDGSGTGAQQYNNSAGAGAVVWNEAAVSGTNATATVGTDLVTTQGTGDFVVVNPVTATNTIAVGSPAIDNAKNVYFTAAKEARIFGSGGTTVKTALYRCEWDPINQVYLAPTKVLEEGDQLDDAINGTQQFVTFLPLSVATSDLTNANIRFPSANCFQPNSLNLKPLDGGASVVAKVSDPNSTPMAPLPTRWSALYLRYK